MAEGHLMAEQQHQPPLLRPPPLPQTAPGLSSPSCPLPSDHLKHQSEFLASNDRQKLFKVVLKVAPNNSNINPSSPSFHARSHTSSPPCSPATSVSFFHTPFPNQQPHHLPYQQTDVLHNQGHDAVSHTQQRSAPDPDAGHQDLSGKTLIHRQIKQIPGYKEAQQQFSVLQQQNFLTNPQFAHYLHAQRQIPHWPSLSLSQHHQLPQISITEENLQELRVRTKEEGEGVAFRKLSPSCKSGSYGMPGASCPQPIAAQSAFFSTSAEVGQNSCKKRKLMEVVDSIKDDAPSAAVPLAYDVSQPKNVNPSYLTLRPGLIPMDKLPQSEQVPITSSKLDAKGSTVPGKKLLKAILDKLQKKDKHRVFSEPVDPEEVPDYYDVIKDPMDFGTMRKRITEGYYTSLELFEKDILTICSNAMQYNGKGTVYHRQAASIKEACNKIMEYLESLDSISDLGSELIAKLRVWGPYAKKSLKRTATANKAFDRMISENTSEVNAGRASDGGGRMNLSSLNGILGRFLERLPGNAATPIDINAEDFPARKQQFFDETRRNTYRSFGFSNEGTGSLVTSISSIHPQFVPTGYQLDFSYARSLARFAADLGPIVWKIASEKIRRALPAGYPFGPGWVGEQDNLGGAIVAPLNGQLPSLFHAHPKMMKVLTDFPSSTLGDSRICREGSSGNLMTGDTG